MPQMQSHTEKDPPTQILTQRETKVLVPFAKDFSSFVSYDMPSQMLYLSRAVEHFYTLLNVPTMIWTHPSSIYALGKTEVLKRKSLSLAVPAFERGLSLTSFTAWRGREHLVDGSRFQFASF